ncbi:DUF5333 domain-containing protein [Histidinibacterium aquaticum]|uniref:DUF5333 domain-containing protein n=1 Tax=Histidinibacterium aquaticum TaxID=2613962 RepID=A0A5J5GNR0_9RHOB|nr:DUF5333 domain-containing protein [Histidinibacterium aquaticum]KAA9009735.1 hypothetical protein F3S47_00215 [Histidinibacterium aquaticum]
MRKTVTALTLLAASAAQAAPLAEERVIREGLIAAGIAYEIGEVCDSLDARLLRGLAYLEQLRGTALELGYTRAEIEAFLDDDAEADRLEAEARARLAAKGAVKGIAESHCAVGRAEIAAGTTIGQLLR